MGKEMWRRRERKEGWNVYGSWIGEDVIIILSDYFVFVKVISYIFLMFKIFINFILVELKI